MSFKLPIIFAINNSYVKQLSTVIVSILLNADSNCCFEFNILSGDLSDENKNGICKLTKYNQNIKFNFIDMNIYTSRAKLEKFMSRRPNYKYITPETYYRFFIPEIFSDYEKVIYLDADLILNDDIRNLYNENIENYYAGVVHDSVVESLLDSKYKIEQYNMSIQEYYQNKLHGNNFNYFNAGVMLLNLDKIRKDNITEKLWDFVISESPLEYQDQDALNAVIGNNVKYIDYKWNVLKEKKFYVQNNNKKLRKYLKHVYLNPSIFHYVGSDKPWSFIQGKDYKYSHINLWWNCYKLTPFYSPEDDEILQNIMWIKKFSSRFNFIAFEILNFQIFDIYIENYRLCICILGIIKFNARLKKSISKSSVNIE